MSLMPNLCRCPCHLFEGTVKDCHCTNKDADVCYFNKKCMGEIKVKQDPKATHYCRLCEQNCYCASDVYPCDHDVCYDNPNYPHELDQRNVPKMPKLKSGRYKLKGPSAIVPVPIFPCPAPFRYVDE